MFKIFRHALLVITAMMAVPFAAGAQQSLPVDSAVVVGKLPNGLTYYIRHNETPKGQADFYIAQKVGSILEEDNQRGLAHFLEHMCFNGTTNFPGNTLIDWLETKGVKFGYNLNAYTSVDETVYNISNVPVNNDAVVDSCLLILRGWANDLLLEPEEIDKERGVIHEEWRRTNIGQMRILEQILPTMFPDSKYAYRLPIGTMEVVDNFPHQALRDYYETWYRPDQQGIVVVGDVDVAYIENKIKEMFSGIEMPSDAKERQYFPVEDTEGTIFAIGSDPEQAQLTLAMMFKSDVFPKAQKNSPMYLMQKYAENMMVNMLDQRYNEMAMKADAPFSGAGVYYGSILGITKTKDALTMQVVAKDLDLPTGFEAAYRELLRAARGGFTDGEYDRARKEYLSRLEKAYNGREKIKNGSYVNEYVRNFIDNEPIPGIENEYAIMQQLAPMVPVDYINELISDLVTDDNRIVMVMGPQKDDFTMPTQEALEAVIAKVDAEDIEPYQEALKAEPLIPELPTPGKIVSETADSQWDATVITLSNGVKVIVKPTDFKKDEILFQAIAKNGTSGLPGDQVANMLFAQFLAMQHGLGDYTVADLRRYLQGKQANVVLSADEYTRTFQGMTSVKDLPTLMELIYMNFTALSSTDDEFQAIQNMVVNSISQQENTPDFQFEKFSCEKLYKSPLSQIPSVDQLKAATREGALDIIHGLTANAADYTFVFVGDIDMDTLKPLLEQYIATLPADAATAVTSVTVNPDVEITPGKAVDTMTYKMETPQTTCAIHIFGDIPYTPKNRQMASMVGQVLSKRLLNKIREEMGAVYSIHASGTMDRVSKYNTSIEIPFPMKPEMKQQVFDEIDMMINDMTTNISEDELKPIQEFMLKSMAEQKEQNSGWLGSIGATQLNGVDIFNGIEDVIKSVTTEDLQQFMQQLLSQGNYRIVVIDPAE